MLQAMTDDAGKHEGALLAPGILDIIRDCSTEDCVEKQADQVLTHIADLRALQSQFTQDRHRLQHLADLWLSGGELIDGDRTDLILLHDGDTQTIEREDIGLLFRR